MPIRKRPWTRPEKWLVGVTLVGVMALSGWGWFENQPHPLHLIERERGNGSNSIDNLLLSPNQKSLVLNVDVYDGIGTHTAEVGLWNAKTLETIPVFNWSVPLKQVCVSEDAAQIGLLNHNHISPSFEWRDRATHKLLWRLITPKSYSAWLSARFLKKTSQILLVAGKYGGGGGSYLISSRTGAIQNHWDGEPYGIISGAISSDEKILATREINYEGLRRTKNRFLVLRRVSNGQVLRRIKMSRDFSSLLFSPDSRFLFLLTAPDYTDSETFDNTVRCLDSRTGQQVWKFDALPVASDINPWRRRQISKQTASSESGPYDFVAFSGIAISKSGATVAVMRAIDSTIYLLDAKTGKPQRTLALPLGKAELSSIYHSTNLLFAPDEKHLFALTADSVFAWDLTAQQ